MYKTSDLIEESWSALRLHEAMIALAKRANLLSLSPDPSEISGYSAPATYKWIDQWMSLTAKRLGIETQSVDFSYVELEQSLSKIGPALIRLPNGEDLQFLAILKGNQKWIQLLTSEQTLRRVPTAQLRAVLTNELETPLVPSIHSLLAEAKIPVERQAVVKTALLRAQLNSTRMGHCWLLRLSPGDDFLKQLGQTRVPRCVATVLGVSLLGQWLGLLGWWVIGKSVLTGHFEWAWMLAWALLLLTTVPMQSVIIRFSHLLSLELGSLLKQRLLYGILHLEADEVRLKGAGHFLGMVMKTESVESLVLAGGIRVPLAILELLIITGVLALGAGGWFHALLLIGWLVAGGVLLGYVFQRTDEWMGAYREMIRAWVERLIGHRTRLVQAGPTRWHEEEDSLLARYLHFSRRKDLLKIAVCSVIEYGWLLVALSGLVYVLTFTPASPAAIALSLGGILLAWQSLNRLITGISSFIHVMVAWKQIRPLFQAATRTPAVGQLLPVKHRNRSPHKPLLSARALTFRYRPPFAPLLQRVHLDLYKGERLLLAGTAGGGKSTLVALLAGLRQPEHGELTLWGLTQQQLGIEAWRQRIAMAPPFHENLIFVETFAFNLLMGRQWPPLLSDLEEAKHICYELGLEDLLTRMPAGLQQILGENGWQLSHGERSRVYIARALLQQADLIILDGSFAALDPENLKRTLQCVLNRAPTLLVIAHPA